MVEQDSCFGDHGEDRSSLHYQLSQEHRHGDPLYMFIRNHETRATSATRKTNAADNVNGVPEVETMLFAHHQ